MRVLLADGNNDVRSALRLLLQEDAGLRSVDEAGSAGDLERQSEQCPDLVIADWGLAATELRGIVQRLRLRNPSTRVIVLSANPEARLCALQAGADYFISMNDPPERLVQLLHDIH